MFKENKIIIKKSEFFNNSLEENKELFFELFEKNKKEIIQDIHEMIKNHESEREHP